ncbi:hypothetical protein ACIQKB_35875 [Streptomyces sp. NPDC092046]|uniref:hypothetical protein n=1 Tax=Streptomyces sp. NPDC092046 TaxID=3366009 RepID=UPI00381F0EA8
MVQGLHWGDEIRSPAELAPPRTDVTEQEIEGALALMDTRLSSTWTTSATRSPTSTPRR